jgi:hypothetical protein
MIITDDDDDDDRMIWLLITLNMIFVSSYLKTGAKNYQISYQQSNFEENVAVIPSNTN